MILTLELVEAEMLKRLLETSLIELRDEIHHTDQAAFKAELKTEELLRRRVIAKLQDVGASHAGMERTPARKAVSSS